MDWPSAVPTVSELIIVDKSAARSAEVAFANEIKELGYVPLTPLVTSFGRKKIVRIGLYDPERHDNAGVAIRTEENGKVQQTLYLF